MFILRDVDGLPIYVSDHKDLELGEFSVKVVVFSLMFLLNYTIIIATILCKIASRYTLYVCVVPTHAL